MESFGYQIDVKCLFSHNTTFIPWAAVQTVFINEVICKVSNAIFYTYIAKLILLHCLQQRVVHVLSLLIKTNSNLVELLPLFKVSM